MEGFDIIGYLLGIAAAVGYMRAQLRSIEKDIAELKGQIKDSSSVNEIGNRIERSEDE